MSAVFTRPSNATDARGVPIPFRPQDYEGCAALLLEPRVKQMCRYEGRDRLEIVVRLSVFETDEDVRTGGPNDVIDMVVTWGRIATLMNRAFVDGQPVAARVGKDAETEHGTRPWRLVDLDAETEALLRKWLGKGRQN